MPPERRRIAALSASLVNRIAAGEVIERPASVVKELVENALDAKATHITIEIEDGGRDVIRVIDDGCGIPPDELPLAFAEHATSKLTCDDDLFRIATMGFRGEALASIGAVSHARILSRTADSDAAFEIVNRGGEMSAPQAAAGNVGTTVEVRNLFFNTPARRKFLRGAATEYGHVYEMVMRLALPFPHVSFKLLHGSRTSLDLPAAGSPTERLLAAWPQEFAEARLPIEARDVELRLSGIIGLPELARPTAKYQYFFLNGRYIRDRFIQHAAKEAYRGLCEPGRHPAAVLMLTVPPQDVDVNVHPTKIEVRFRDGGRVHGLVLASIRERLLGSDLSPAAKPSAGVSEAIRPDMRQRLADFFKQLPQNIGGGTSGTAAPASTATRLDSPLLPRTPRDSSFDFALPNRGAPGSYSAPATMPVGPPSGSWNLSRSASQTSAAEPLSRSSAQTPALPLSMHVGTSDARATDATSPASVDTVMPVESAPDPRTPDAVPFRAIQVHNSYLVAQSEDGVVIIDQHALHERVMYEELRARLLRGPLESQRMLIPPTIPASSRQIALLDTLAPLLGRLGIELTSFGPQSLAIQAFPTFLAKLDPGEFVRELLERAEHEALDLHEEELLHDLLDMMACKAAVKAGDPLSPEEIDALLSRRELVERSSNCPHGRPTTLRLTLHELEKQFKRTGF